MMRAVQLLAGSLRNRAVVLIARLFSFSISGTRLITFLLLPVEIIRCMRSWPWVIKFGKMLLPGQSAVRNLLRYHLAQADQAAWSALVHNAWDHALKYNDFGSVDDLRIIGDRGKGIPLLGMHYGAFFGGYVLYKSGLNPAILAAQVNIPDLGRVPLKRLLTNEYVFRGSYDGIAKAGYGERRFVSMMLAHRPGVIIIDGISETNFILTKCLGVDYPIVIFPFKLALAYDFPVAIMWFSKIKGRGYKLNVREINFSTVEEGVNQYGALLDQVVRADPFRWFYGPNFARHYDRMQEKPSAKVISIP